MKIIDFLPSIKKSHLFKDFTDADIIELFNVITVKAEKYDKEEIIYTEEDVCNSLCLIIEGKVEIQKIDPTGKVLTVAVFSEGDEFGENLIFSDITNFPMTVVSKTASKILSIPKESVVKLCQMRSEFLYEYLRTISNKALMLSRRIKDVTLKTIRQKIAEYIIEEYKKQKKPDVYINISKKEWADKLGVQRPSLSRELIKMKEEGIIDYGRDIVKIIDLGLLESFIL